MGQPMGQPKVSLGKPKYGFGITQNMLGQPMGKPIIVKFFIGVYTILLSMLYEKSRVSQYERKDRLGKVKTQINLG
jgi:hypothetical protein